MMSAGLMSSTRRGVRPAVAYGWTTSDYYSGTNGEGRGSIGTVRLVGRLESLPAASTKVAAGRMNGTATGGWRIDTGSGGSGTINALSGGASGYNATPNHTFSGGDVGAIFTLHAWIDGSNYLHLSINGTHIGPSATSYAPADAGSVPVWIGRWAGGYACSHIGVIALSASATGIDSTAAAADAARILDSEARIIPALTGQDMHYLARDVMPSGGSWHDRAGDDATLTESGSVTFAWL